MIRRLFFAVNFPDAVKIQLGRHATDLAALAGKGRWTRPENLHLTLQFLGDCPDEWQPALLRAAETAAAVTGPFDLTLDGAGTFGRNHDILWIGANSSPELKKLAAALNRELAAARLPCDERPLNAHITVGRQVRIAPGLVRDWSMPQLNCHVDRFYLMESTRLENQLVYLPLSQCLLTGP